MECVRGDRDSSPPSVVTVGREDLDARFFEGALGAGGTEPVTVREVAWRPLLAEGAILSTLGDGPRTPGVGLYAVTLAVTNGGGEGRVSLVVKSKRPDTEILRDMSLMALACGPSLSSAWNEHCLATPFAGSHLREIGIYSQRDERFLRHVPRIYRTVHDDARQAFIIVMEDLSDAAVIDAVNDTAAWTPTRLEATIRCLAELHAVWLGREPELARQPWLGNVPTARDTARMANLWTALAEHAARTRADLFDGAVMRRRLELITTIGEWRTEMEQMPRTLVHNDFNPRNLALRIGPDGEHQLKAYDWEVATLQVPQYDLAELLAHTLPPDASAAQVSNLVELHRSALSEAAGRQLDPRLWARGFQLALRDFAVKRLAFIFIAAAFRGYPFLERVFRTTQRLQAIAGDA